MFPSTHQLDPKRLPHPSPNCVMDTVSHRIPLNRIRDVRLRGLGLRFLRVEGSGFSGIVIREK